MDSKATAPKNSHPAAWLSRLEVKSIVALLVGVAFVLSGGLAGWLGVKRIAEVSSPIVTQEIPTTRTIQELLIAMSIANLSVEQALDIEKSERIQEYRARIERFAEEREHAEALIAALTWGSETDAFALSAGGRNAATWERLGYKQEIIVPPPDDAIAQSAGAASLYYQGFVNNVERALIENDRYIQLTPQEKVGASREALRIYMAKARNFSELAAVHLSEIVELSNTRVHDRSLELIGTQETTRNFVLLTSFIAMISILVLGTLFVRRVVLYPVRELARTAERFGKGDLSERIELKTDDEFETLGNTFNGMAAKIARYTSELEEQVKERTKELAEKVETLDKTNQQLDRSGKLLIRRDLELTRANERLRTLDQMKSDFVSTATHQMRTPLSGIKWTLSMLLKGDVGPLTNEQRTFLMKTYESNDRMLALLSDLLLSDKIDSGKLQGSPDAATMMPDLLDNMLTEIQPIADKQHITLRFAGRKDSYPSVKIDAQDMRAILQNLIENAVKYTRPGGAVNIEVQVDAPERIRIAVSDTGIGIPTIQQKNIFSRFFRGANAARMEPDGSGLGLFIAKGIVEKYGGTIGFQSKEGDGTTFHVELPIIKSNGKQK